MNKVLSKKGLTVCLAVAVIVIVVGAFLAGFVGYNPDSTHKNYSVIEVTDAGYSASDAQDEFVNFCKDEISKTYAVSDVKVTQSYTTGTSVFTYYVDGTPDRAFCDKLETAIAGCTIEGVNGALASVTFHEGIGQNYSDYVWRTAVGAAVAFVLLFVYVAIRFRLGMGVTVLIAGVHDALLLLALAAIVRLPVSPAFAGVAVFVLLLSGLLNLFVFGRMRTDLRTDEFKAKSASEAVSDSVRNARPAVLVVSAAIAVVAVILAVVGVFTGIDLTFAMIAALIGIALATYSALVVSPAVYALIKQTWDAKRAEKAKYNYSSDKKKKEAKPAEAAGELE